MKKIVSFLFFLVFCLSASANSITYSTTDGKALSPNNWNAFLDSYGRVLSVTSNVYANGKGTLTLSGNVAQIGESAFANCETLKTIEAPQTVTKIGRKAFSCCRKMTTFSTLESLTSIGYAAFEECNYLANISIHGTVQTIEDYTFSQCAKLKWISLPGTITKIGNYAFTGCKNLTTIYLKSKNPATLGTNVFESTIYSTCSLSIPSGGYYNYKGTSIWKNFEKLEEEGIADIKSLSIGSDFTLSIGYKKKLQATVTPTESSSVSILWASSNTSVATINTSGEVMAIGSGTCTITATTADKSATKATCKVTVTGNSGYTTVSTISYTSTDNNVVTPYNPNAFLDANDRILTIISNVYTNGQGTISLSGDIAQIGENAFANCQTLKTIEFPQTVQRIGRKAFSCCRKMTTFATLENLAEVGYAAFEECNVLANIKLLGSVQKIEDYTFSQCAKLKWISLPETISRMGSYAFSGCKNLEKIYIKPATAPTLGTNVFEESIFSKCSIVIRYGSYYSYRGANGWSSFTSIVEDELTDIKGISISQSLHLAIGEKTVLRASVSPVESSNVTIFWTSSNPSVASVNASGEVQALKAGTCTITATSADESASTASCLVTVGDNTVKVERIELDRYADTLFEGDSFQYKATVYPLDADNKAIIWSSSNNYIATVSDGIVYAVSEGVCRITATSAENANVSASCEITVTKASIHVESIELDRYSNTLYQGESFQLSATVYPLNAENKTISWSSSNNAVAMVSDGFVYAVSEGVCCITATSAENSNISASCEITVTKAPIHVSNIVLQEIPATIFVGDEFQIQAMVYPEDADNQALTWTSSDNNIALVGNGYVYALSEGTCQITATSMDNANVSAYCEITVMKAPVHVDSIEIQGLPESIMIGDVFQLSAIVYPDDADNKALSWISSDNSIARVTDGMVTAISVGTCQISVTSLDNGISAVCDVIVKRETVHVKNVILLDIPVSFSLGDEYQLKAMVYPEDADNKNLIWSTSDENIAVIDPSTGYIRVVGNGTFKIRITSEENPNIYYETPIETPILLLQSDQATPTLYNLDGTRSTNLHSGINLRVNANGKIEKI